MDYRVAIQPQADHFERPPSLEREPERAAEDNQVTLTDLDQEDLAGRSTYFWLASTVLKWQRFPQRRYWRLAWLPSFLLGLVVVLLMSQGFSSLLVKSLTTALLPPSPPSPSMIPLPPSTLGVTTVHTWCPPPGYHENYPGGAGLQPGAAQSLPTERAPAPSPTRDPVKQVDALAANGPKMNESLSYPYSDRNEPTNIRRNT